MKLNLSVPHSIRIPNAHESIKIFESPHSAGWSWRLELECCERKILLGWLELELVAGVV